jgi:Family of unknown function (DUF6790)
VQTRTSLDALLIVFSVTMARAQVPSQLFAFGCDSQTGVCAKCLSNRIDSEGLGLALGISNLINFVFHVFFDDTAAKFIGWENSPFQAEVGFAGLGVGIAGVVAFKASLPFGFATLIPPSAFSLGAAGGHIHQMIVAHNFSPGNVGVVLPIDIVMPIIGLVFLWLSYKHANRGALIAV